VVLAIVRRKNLLKFLVVVSWGFRKLNMPGIAQFDPVADLEDCWTAAFSTRGSATSSMR